MLGQPISGQALGDIDFFKVEQVHVIGAASVSAAFKVTRPLVTSFSATTAVADTLRRAVDLKDSGGFSGTSAVSDTLRRAVDLKDSGGFAGTSSMADFVKVARKFIEALIAQANISGAIKATRPLSDSVVGQASVVDTLKRAVSLLDGGGLAGAASLGTMSMRVARHLIEGILGAAAVGSIPMPVARTLIDTIHGTVAITGSAKVSRAYAVACAGQGTLVIPTQVHRTFIASAAGSAALSDALSIARKLSLVLAGNVIVAVDLTVGTGVTQLAVVLAGTSTASFTWIRHRPLAAGFVGHASETDSIKVLRSMADSILGKSGFTDAFKVGRALSAIIEARGSGYVGHIRATRSFATSISAEVLVQDAIGVRRPLGLPLSGDAHVTDAAGMLRGLGLILRAQAIYDEQMAIARAMGLSVSANATFVGLFVLNPPIPVPGGSFNVTPADYPVPPVPPPPIIIRISFKL